MTTAESKRKRELESLLAERKKFEAWLAQLEARRGSTAERVYTRVHDDYVSRLGAVREKLAAESDAITALVAETEARLSLEHDRVSEKSDELAESELRASVGEFSEKEWESARAELEREIAKRRAQFDATERELSDLKALLNSIRGPSGAARVSAQRAAVVSVEIDLVEATRNTPAAEEPAVDQPESATGVDEDSALDAVPAADAFEDVVASETPDDTLPEVKDESVAAVADEPGIAPFGDANDGPVDTGSAAFDELAFLRSVAGTPAGHGALPAVSEGIAATTPELPSRAARGRGTVEEPPSGPRGSGSVAADSAADANGDSGTDADQAPLGAPTPRTSQAVRTLKCQECGTLNFPTEWYCERCGGELAAF